MPPAMTDRRRRLPGGAWGLCLLALAAAGAMPASPALALPVLDAVSLTPGAISPNNDGVQEFTEIRYTIAADSADVRILLTVSGGAVLVDTLQVFTRQSGKRSRVFDGNVRSGPLPDGAYEVRILAVGAQGEGSEQAVLPLEVDRVAPVITSLALVTPAAPVVQDGTRITVQACMEGNFETVSADFSALDSGYIAGAVSSTSVSDACRRFTYTITPANTLADRNGLPVTVTARDKAGNRATRSLDFCLSNSPPVILTATLLNSVPVFQNGDQIRTEIQVTSPNEVSVRGDFVNLDSGYAPAGVEVERLSAGRFRLNYTISAANARPDGDYRLRLYAYDVNGCGVDADSSLTVTLDNAGALPALIGGVSVNNLAYSPNDDLVKDDVTFGYTVLEDTVTVKIIAEYLVRGSTTVQTNLIFSGSVLRGPQSYKWNGQFPVSLSQIDDQILNVKVRAISVSQDRQRDELFKIALDRTAPVFDEFVPPTFTSVKNNQQFSFTVKWDGAGYDLAADFSELDSNFPRAVSVTDNGDRSYRVTYTVSPDNARPDGSDKDVRLTATDAAGNSAANDLVRFCLSNLPPRLASATLLSKDGPYRKLDQISFRTKWVDGQWTSAKPLQVTADFSKVDSEFADRLDQVIIVPGSSAIGDTVIFDIAYRFSTNNEIEQTETDKPLPINVTARDHEDLGCGVGTAEALRVHIDSVVPPRPTLTASAGVSRAPVDTLRGVAEEAAMVIIFRGTTPVDTFEVRDVSGNYSGPIPLDPGENRFNAQSVDIAGNVSKPTAPDLVIFYVQGDVVQIPSPFTPGKEFFVGLLSPARSVDIRVFNLDGVEVARLPGATGDLLRVKWDGTDDNGEVVSSGPYIAVVEIVDAASGRIERFKKAFIFARRESGS